MVSVGTFIIKDSEYLAAMPERNESGLWQAWKMSDGSFMVQPLDRDRAPWGTMHLLESGEFSRMLEPARFPGGADGGAAKPGYADADDLLFVWYEQALAEQKVDICGGDPLASPLAAKPHKVRISSEESVLVPSWHPDDLFSDEKGAKPEARPAGSRPDEAAGGSAPATWGSKTPEARAVQAAAAAVPTGPDRSQVGNAVGVAASETFFAEDDLLSDILVQEPFLSGNPLDFMPTLSLELNVSPEPALPAAPTAAAPVSAANAAGDDEPGAPAFQDDDAYAEARAARLEQRMREEFALLLEKLDKGGTPEIENELSRLVLRGEGFSWKQKFMFTEFGCTLRRKRLPKAALASHMRALSFAPTDEHILFNVARSEYELGNTDAARMYLARALESAPAFGAARRFLAFLDGHSPNG